MITQVGSLPYESIEQAVEYSLKHNIPFLPELPKRGDYMLEYIKQPGKLSCLDEFKKQVKKHNCEKIKVQCVGPSTLLFNGYKEVDAIKRIQEHLNSILSDLTAKEIVLFLDEPTLTLKDSTYKAIGINENYSDLLHKVFDKIYSKQNLVTGIHTCNNMSWNELFDLNPLIKIISFDSSKYGEEFVRSKKYRGNKRIAWGILKKEDVIDFQQGDLLTLPCGMSPPEYNVRDCDRNLEMLIKISKELSS